MTERQLGHVLFRVLGLWMIAEAVAQSGVAYSQWVRLSDPPTGWEISAVIAPMAIYLATGLVVWGWADRLAALVFSDSPGPGTAPPPSVSGVYRAVVSALGLFLVVTAAPNAVSWLAVWLQASAGGTSPDSFNREELLGITAKANFASILAQCLLGAFLYLGPQRILSWARQEFSSRLAEDEREK